MGLHCSLCHTAILKTSFYIASFNFYVGLITSMFFTLPMIWVQDIWIYFMERHQASPFQFHPTSLKSSSWALSLFSPGNAPPIPCIGPWLFFDLAQIIFINHKGRPFIIFMLRLTFRTSRKYHLVAILDANWLILTCHHLTWDFWFFNFLPYSCVWGNFTCKNLRGIFIVLRCLGQFLNGEAMVW